MSAYDYPRLKRSEIIAYLAETQIVPNISENHLTNPSPDIVYDIYTRLLTHLCNFKEDDMMDFNALAQLENPEFHVEGMRKMKLYGRVKEVLTCLKCPKNFNLRDMFKPDADRTESFISAIVNFCIYKENKMNEIEPNVNELNLLYEQHQEWAEKISLLNDDIARHNEARENERPYIQEVEGKIRELQQTVLELNKRQVSLRTSYRTLKENSAEMDAKLSSAEFSLVQAVQENANLRSKIVQSPDKLQAALEEKRSLRDEAVKAEKSAKQALDEKNTVSEVYTKALKKMGKHINQMEKIQELIISSKSIDQELKLLKEKFTSDGLLDKQLDAKLMELNRRVDQLEEEKKNVYNERQVKIEEATRELDNMYQEVESRKQELETRQRKVAAMVEESESNTLKTNEVKESSKAKQLMLMNQMDELLEAARKYSFRNKLPSK